MKLDVVICFIVVIFTNVQDVFTILTTRSEVESELVCTSKWQNVNLNWNFTVTNTSQIQSFNSFWSQNEDEFKRKTVERLSQAIIYPRNFTKTFLCYGAVSSYTGSNTNWRYNVSFDIWLPKVDSTLLGVRFMSIPESKRLEFYIRPRTKINDISYRLYYCAELEQPDILFDFEKNYTCPRYVSVQFRCKHHKDVYEIPDSAGFICEALTKHYIYYQTNYSFHIRSTTQDGFTSVSHNFRVLTSSSSDKPISRYADHHGFFEVVLIGRRPEYLTAVANKQQIVTLQWEDVGLTAVDSYSHYRISFLCNNGFSSSLTHKMRTSVTIYNNSFAPYMSCRFCVSVLVGAGTLYSEPVCNTTRFPEEAPSKPPRITCDFNSCPTNDSKETRSVKVTCEFPDEKYRNGVLNKLVINYWNDISNHSASENVDETNLTICEITLTGLSKRHTHFAQMLVCNSEGCSSFSDAVSIALAVYRANTTDNKSELWLLTLLLVVPIMVGIIYFSVQKWRRLKKSKQEKSLPTVVEPNSYEELEASMANKLHEYDELPKQDDNENLHT